MSLAEFESSFEVPFKVKVALENDVVPCSDIPEAWWGSGNERGKWRNDEPVPLTKALGGFQSWYDQHLEFFARRGGMSDIDRWFVGKPYIVDGEPVGLVVEFHHRLGGFPFKEASYAILCTERGVFLTRWGAPE